MKKICLLTGILILTGISVFAVDTSKYNKVFRVRFATCLPCVTTSNFEDNEGNSVSVKRTIGGARTGICRYSEVETKADETVSYSCRFSMDQVRELSAAMKSDPDGLTSSDAVWERYKKNQEICTKN